MTGHGVTTHSTKNKPQISVNKTSGQFWPKVVICGQSGRFWYHPSLCYTAAISLLYVCTPFSRSQVYVWYR